MPERCPVTWRTGYIARGYEDIIGRGLKDDTLKDVTSNLEEELKEEAQLVFLESVDEGLSIKECIAIVHDEVLHKVPKQRNKWFIQFVYDNRLQIEIGVNMFKNGNSQFYHSLGLYDPDKEENECPLADWTPCACKDHEKRQMSEVMKELMDRGELPRVTLKKQITNDKSHPWIQGHQIPESLPPNPTNSQNARSLENWETWQTPPSCLGRSRSLESPGGGYKRARSLDRRHGRTRNKERLGSRERSSSLVGERPVRGLGDCFRGCRPSQDRLRESEKVAWVRKRKDGEGGTFALERNGGHHILANVKLSGRNEVIEHKRTVSEQNKITKLVFRPDKDKNRPKSSSSRSTPSADKDIDVSESNKNSNDNWISKCLELDVGRQNNNKDEHDIETSNKNIHQMSSEASSESSFPSEKYGSPQVTSLPPKSPRRPDKERVPQISKYLSDFNQTLNDPRTIDCLEIDVHSETNNKDICETETSYNDIQNIPLEAVSDKGCTIEMNANSDQSEKIEDTKQGGIFLTGRNSTPIYDEDEEDTEEGNHYIICRETSQSTLYDMEQDLVYKEETVEGNNISNNVNIENGESFVVKDDIDAQFEALFSDSEESNDGEAVEPIQKMPIEIQNIEEVELQKPVFSKTFKPKTAMMFAKIEKPENPVKYQDDSEVHSFFSKPFSPDAVQKWNEKIKMNQPYPVNGVQEHYGSRQL